MYLIALPIFFHFHLALLFTTSLSYIDAGAQRPKLRILLVMYGVFYEHWLQGFYASGVRKMTVLNNRAPIFHRELGRERGLKEVAWYVAESIKYFTKAFFEPWLLPEKRNRRLSFQSFSSQQLRRLAISPSGIASKLNRSQLSAVSRVGQSGEVIDWLARRCLPLGLFSAASGAFAVEQKYHHQSGNAVSGKLVRKLH